MLTPTSPNLQRESQQRATSSCEDIMGGRSELEISERQRKNVQSVYGGFKLLINKGLE